MGWFVALLLAPIVFMLVAAYVVLKVAAFGLRVIFARRLAGGATHAAARRVTSLPTMTVGWSTE
jgi:hypothetical protein